MAGWPGEVVVAVAVAVVKWSWPWPGEKGNGGNVVAGWPAQALWPDGRVCGKLGVRRGVQSGGYRVGMRLLEHMLPCLKQQHGFVLMTRHM